jgi:hypothetical protein
VLSSTSSDLWVTVSQLFEGTYRIPLHGNESVNSLITLKMKAVTIFEKSEINYPSTQGNNSDTGFLKLAVEVTNIPSPLPIVKNVYFSLISVSS